MKSLVTRITETTQKAILAAYPDLPADVDPVLRESDHADFQINAALALSKKLGQPPRAVADSILSHLELGSDALILEAAISGPGFINITLSAKAAIAQAVSRIEDVRLGISSDLLGQKVVIDYSQPNIAKEMHVGHLRSTVIGDSLVRCYEYLGATVARQNHLGDWGTQFGMLIQYLLEDEQAHIDVEKLASSADAGSQAISHLNALYKKSRERFNSDPEFADRARRKVVDLQAGDEQTLASWQEIVAESKIYFKAIYERLGVKLTDEDAVGESFYNPMLEDVVQDLEQKGVAVQSEGALCVFFDDILNPEGKPTPLMVRKSDGGFGYAATDMAAIRYRTLKLKADKILYVVDARQALHFRMVFEAATRAGYLPDSVHVEHVPFGTVLGKDGKPFKSRDGETIRLIELLDEAVARAKEIVAEKNPQLSPDELAQRSKEVGIGAVKYADLSTSRSRDYMFDFDRMISLQGNTGVYLQYAHARICSILRRLAEQDKNVQVLSEAEMENTEVASISDKVAELSIHPAEKSLAVAVDGLSAAVDSVIETNEPHKLCLYLYSLAQKFSDFYENCPVLKAENAEIKNRRVGLLRSTEQTLKLGLSLLGIAAPERL